MNRKRILRLFALIALLAVLLIGGIALRHSGGQAPSAETDTCFTLSDLIIDAGGEEIAVASEARLRARQEDDRSAFAFELALEDRLYLPVRIEIGTDGASFSLGESGRVYTADTASLAEQLGLSETAMERLRALKTVLQSGVSLLRQGSDARFQEQSAEVLSRMAQTLLSAENEDVQTEIDGGTYDGQYYHGSLNAERLNALLQYMQNCEIAEIAALSPALAQLFSPEDIEDADMELTLVLNGSVRYGKCVLRHETSGMNVETVLEILSTDADTRLTLIQIMGDPADSGTEQTIDLQIDGAISAPTALRFAMDYLSRMDFSSDAEGSAMGMAMNLKFDAAKADGLWSATLDGNIDMTLSDSTGDVSSALPLSGSYAETAEADGSITGALSFSLGDDGTGYGLSFRLHRSEAAALTPLSEIDSPLSLTDGDAPAALDADMDAFAADAAELAAADAGIYRLLTLLTLNASEEEAYVYDESILQAESLEAAADIYGGTIPAYAAPEGYALVTVNVNEAALEAIYSDGNARFSYSLMDLGVDLELEAEISYVEDGAGSVLYAEMILGSNYVMFNFEGGADPASAEAIVSGLHF